MLLPALIPTFLFVIPAEPRQRRGPESITTGSGYGFRARGLRPRPGMTSQNLRGLVLPSSERGNPSDSDSVDILVRGRAGSRAQGLAMEAAVPDRATAVNPN